MTSLKVYRFTAEFTMVVPEGIVDATTAAVIVLDSILELPPVLTAQGVVEPTLVPEIEAHALLVTASLAETV